MRYAAMGLALIVGGCGGGSGAAGPVAAPAPAAPVAAPAAPSPEIAAPPFSAEQIRQAMPVGTRIVLRIAVAGQAPLLEEMTVTAADESGCTIQSRKLAEDGGLLQDAGPSTVTWAGLESHAHFPASATSRSDSKVTVPAGSFDTWLYVVRSSQPDGEERRMHFARALPGPPISMEVVRGGAPTMTMTLVSREPRPR
jgi:hypothetical protein